KLIKQGDISKEFLGGRVNKFTWSGSEFDYTVTFAGGYFGAKANFIRVPKGDKIPDREETLSIISEPDLFMALLGELEKKSGARLAVEKAQKNTLDEMIASLHLSDTDAFLYSRVLNLFIPELA